MSGRKYYCRASGADGNALRRCLRWLCEGDEDERCVVFGALQQIEVSVFAEVLGEDVAKRAKRDRYLLFRDLSGEDTRVDVYTESTLPGSLAGVRVLLLWPTDAAIQKVDARRSSMVLALEWAQDAAKWATWGFEEMGAAPPKIARQATTLLEAAVDLIVRMVPARSVLNRSDRSSCIELFRLIHAEVDLNSHTVVQRLVAAGWQVRDAEEVGDLASGVAAGKRFRTSPEERWAPNIVEQLRATLGSTR